MYRPDKDVTQVDRFVFISGIAGASDQAQLKRHGITRVVRMSVEDTGVPRFDGVAYLDCGVRDHPAEDIRGAASDAVAFIQRGVARGEKTLVHCHAGISRSATAVLLHLMLNLRADLDTALGHLRGVRPIVQPNRGFMRMLRHTEQKLGAGHFTTEDLGRVAGVH